MSQVTAYHFWSPTCGPCKVIKPMIEELKTDFSTVNWLSINTHDDSSGYAAKLGVTVVPTIVVVSDKGIEKFSGTQAAGYYRILSNATKQ
jgi:thioredoxin-like negative regulator of GroEL